MSTWTHLTTEEIYQVGNCTSKETFRIEHFWPRDKEISYLPLTSLQVWKVRGGRWGVERSSVQKLAGSLVSFNILLLYGYYQASYPQTDAHEEADRIPELICKQAFISCLSRPRTGTLSIQIIVLSQWCKPPSEVRPSQRLDAQCHWTQGADD